MVAVAAMSTDLAIRVRSAESSDMAYVASTWRDGWWGSNSNRRLSGRNYHPLFDRVVIAGILAERDTRVIVACDESDPDTIIAWACYTPGIPTLHWAYTREAHPATGEYLRRRGLFAVLMTTIGVREGGSMAYSFRPQEFGRNKMQGSWWKRLRAAVEPALLDAARARRVAVSYVPVDEFLGNSRK